MIEHKGSSSPVTFDRQLFCYCIERRTTFWPVVAGIRAASGVDLMAFSRRARQIIEEQMAPWPNTEPTSARNLYSSGVGPSVRAEEYFAL